MPSIFIVLCLSFGVSYMHCFAGYGDEYGGDYGSDYGGDNGADYGEFFGGDIRDEKQQYSAVKAKQQDSTVEAKQRDSTTKQQDSTGKAKQQQDLHFLPDSVNQTALQFSIDTKSQTEIKDWTRYNYDETNINASTIGDNTVEGDGSLITEDTLGGYNYYNYHYMDCFSNKTNNCLELSHENRISKPMHYSAPISYFIDVALLLAMLNNYGFRSFKVEGIEHQMKALESEDLTVKNKNLESFLRDTTMETVCLDSHCFLIVMNFTKNYHDNMWDNVIELFEPFTSDWGDDRGLFDAGNDENKNATSSDLPSGPKQNEKLNQTRQLSKTTKNVRICVFDYGSFTTFPKLHICDKVVARGEDKKALIDSCHEGATNVKTVEVLENGMCENHRKAETLQGRKIAWVFAKTNYLIIGCNYVLIIWLLVTTLAPNKSYHSLTFGVVDAIWLLWRLQETLNFETDWTRNVPYVCVGLNTVYYLTSVMCLYLFAYTSMDRYHALAAPLKWYTVGKGRLFRNCVIAAVMVGIAGSLLNILALFLLDDQSVLKYCSVHGDVEGSLTFLVSSKIINLLFLYCCPCCVLIFANVAIAFAARCHRSQPMILRKHSQRAEQGNTAGNNKLQWVIRFLIFSSLFMLCCLPAPILDLIKAFHSSFISKKAEFIADGIVWNLTTLAFAINVSVGMKFTM